MALLTTPAIAQQVSDPDADVSVATPAYVADSGPVIAIDASHENFHTVDGRYAPTSAVARSDGYRVVSLDAAPTAQTLSQVKILVVANALTPFAAQEVAAIRAWVEAGGSLLLIADHMPFGTAADGVAKAFGFRFEDSFAAEVVRGPEVFSKDNGRLLDSPITRGQAKGKPVDKIISFTGTVLHAPAGATPLMRLGSGWSILYPKEAWKFDETTPTRPSTEADLRGAAMEVGKGRIALFSEAAMFSAQRANNGAKAGFNAPGAEQNKQFLLNVLHWLSRAQ
ncbi:hypothetical protein ACN2C7_08955 [Caulobacter sp. ErkDOM-E]|uniref:hypothetical protein n=1 Tax=Caulobacter sp. ErkDOM-E TaxID=3402778 RepID=UPI003AF713A4